MKTIKAGCFLVDKKTGKIALIYRAKQKDFSFPKGHLEDGESVEACAIRETNEETKRDCEIIEKFPPFVEKYVSSNGEDCLCYMFIALDKGASDNKSSDSHELCWTDFDDVEEKLSYPNLKKTWNAVKGNVKKVLKS